MKPVISSVDGGWIGSLEFGDSRLPEPFEASFVRTDEDGAFTGRTSDPGPSGQASIEGRQVGRHITFTAFYIATKTGQHTPAVDYDGLISEDGDTLAGAWKTRSGVLKTESGTWQVFRGNSKRAVANGLSWPPSEAKMLRGHELNSNAFLEAMTAKIFGGQMTLTKPSRPIGSQRKSQLAAAITFGLSIVFLIFAITSGLALISRGISHVLLISLSTSLIASIFLGFIVYKWYRSDDTGDAYVLDRAGDSISKNMKKVGLFSQIDRIEVKSTPKSAETSTVSIVMKDSRRIVLETGRTKDALALSNDIGQFAGVEVVAIS